MRLSVGLHGTALSLAALHPAWWPGALGAVAANHAGLALAGCLPRSAALGPVLHRMAAENGAVALSFDDGPDPAVTPAVLDLLAAHGAGASFFCIGRRAQAHPALVRRIVGAGHRVENHSLTHPLHFAFLAGAALRREVAGAQAVLADAAGIAPCWFRPPMGIRSPLLDPALAQAGLRLATWTRRGYDTRSRDPAAVLGRLVQRLAPGDLLLLHDGHAARTASGMPVVLKVLPGLLAALGARGFSAVALPAATAGMAGAAGTPPSAGYALP